MAEKLPEQVIMDLGDAATAKVGQYLKDALQLIPDNSQRMVVSIHVAAFPFAMAARFMQAGMHEKDGVMPEWKECVEAAVRYIAKVALENPPNDLPLSATKGSL
jgi:hypothetical protein